MEDKTVLYPLVAGAGYKGATFYGLSVPDWVGIATIVYLVVIGGIAVHKYIKEHWNDKR